ncbi:MAG: hypothetical protein ACM3N9_08035 [Syntrophothermus sp.]
MEKSEKILTLNNQFEATMLSQVLTDKNIPHALVPLTDSAFGGIENMEAGWGYVEAPAEYTDQILFYYDEVLKAKPQPETE